MDALKVKSVYWQKQRKIPGTTGTTWTICGYSRSAYRTGFHIPELDLLLDAGPQHHGAPTNILITHGHIDHIASLPLTMLGATKDKMFTVGAPAEAVPYIANYVQAMFNANATAPITVDWCRYRPLRGGDTFRTEAKGSQLAVEVFGCDHPVPTVSYGISEVKRKIKPKYEGRPGRELAALRKDGVEITAEQTVRRLAYVCDTTIKIFETHPEILEYPCVMIECTFVTDEELGSSAASKHIHWRELEPYVAANPDVEFVLFHFSQRLSDAALDSFFGEKKMANLSWW